MPANNYLKKQKLSGMQILWAVSRVYFNARKGEEEHLVIFGFLNGEIDVISVNLCVVGEFFGWMCKTN